MLVLLLSFLAGVLTVLAPCVLPLLPVILGGSLDASDQDKKRPYIIVGSLVVSLILFTILLKASTVLIGVDPRVWSVAAGVLVIGLGFFMLFPNLWAQIIGRLGVESGSQRLLGKAFQNKSRTVSAVLTGAALGPVFSSCSPTYAWVLATVLPANAALGVVYLAAYSVGLAAALLAVALFGRKLLARVKWASNPHGWFQRSIAILFILVGLFVATGWDKNVQTWLVDKDVLNLIRLEEKLVPGSDKKTNNQKDTTMSDGDLSNVTPYAAPELMGTGQWFNSKPLKLEELKGKVVLIDFWTYSCINCIRTLPYLQAWYDAYKDDGLVIIGVHAPEFAFEKVAANVEQAVKDRKLTYPIVQDNDFATWRAFGNQYWPAHYLIDKDGKVRREHFGEGEYDQTEKAIRALLAEAGNKATNDVTVKQPVKVPVGQDQTPETYLGYERARNFANASELVDDKPVQYKLADNLGANEWSLGGLWQVGAMDTVSKAENNVLSIKFSAKEVYLVMDGPRDTTITMTVNGQAVTSNHNGGADVGEAGRVHLDSARLYKLINMPTFTKDATLNITVPQGVIINAFTFGG